MNSNSKSGRWNPANKPKRRRRKKKSPEKSGYFKSNEYSSFSTNNHSNDYPPLSNDKVYEKNDSSNTNAWIKVQRSTKTNNQSSFISIFDRAKKGYQFINKLPRFDNSPEFPFYQ